VPGGAGGLYVTAARQLLALVGVKIDPAANFALGTLSTALAGGPIAWATWGVGLLFNLFSMGTFSKTLPLADNIDADGDGFADDSASLRQEFRRGFFGGVKQTKHNIIYDVNGVDIRLLQSAAVSITPEVKEVLLDINFGDKKSYAVIDGQRLEGGIVDEIDRSVPVSGDGQWAKKYFFEVSPSLTIVQNGRRVLHPMAGQRIELVMTENGYARRVETGSYVLKVDATYAAINPSTAPVSTSQSWVVNSSVAGDWWQAMGGGSVTMSGTDARAAEGTLLAGALDQMTAQYKGNRNDPNLYMYMDMNGDNVPDRVRVGLQTDGLKVKGDGKVEVWLLDANRQETGITYLAANFSDAEQIGLRSPQLLQWGAGRPDLWRHGRDLGSFFGSARNTGALALMDEATALTASTVTALLEGRTSDMTATFARIDEINRALASPFNATQYMERHPDVAAWAGGDPAKAALHYINWGNSEGRALNPDGLVLARPVIKWFQDGGTMRATEQLVSLNGQYYAEFQQDGNLVVYEGTPAAPRRAVWDSGTWGKAPGGFLSIQSDGNLVVQDASGKPIWASGSEGTGVNRQFSLQLRDDGNLVLVDTTQGGEVIWSKNTGKLAKPEPNVATAASATAAVRTVVDAGTPPAAPSAASPTALLEGGTLGARQRLTSQNGAYFAEFQADGNLAVYNGTPGRSARLIWSSGTRVSGIGGQVSIQRDGNLVIKTARGQTAWSTGTGSEGVDRAFTLNIQNDGNLVLQDARQGGEVLWSSMTGRISLPEPNDAARLAA
jgi:hypothetical protein